METQYPDTRDGAKQFIENETVLIITDSTTYEPDPVVHGVWAVRGLKDTFGTVDALIEMAGYPGPFGVVRKTNDFEVCEKIGKARI